MDTSNNSAPLIRGKTTVHALLLLVMLISALGVRLYNIDKPPLDFASVRQYQLAHIARAYYYEHLDSVPAWEKNVADLNLKRMGLLLEPRIIEHLALFGYRIAGAEQLWIPRVLSSVFWITGGVFLWLIAGQLSFSPVSALFSVAFYLFLPFGILASRSFQPDPMMIMMLLAGIFAVIRYHERPSATRMLMAAGLSSIAILIKPYCLFLICFAFVALSLSRKGVRSALKKPSLYLFLTVILIPSALYYLYGIISGTGFLREQAQASFLPGLLYRKYFWTDWLSLIGQVVGYIPFALALAGTFSARKGGEKTLLYGLWCGYVIFGLVFTYHIHTHDYYHMQLIPIVALSVGPIGGRMISALSGVLAQRKWVFVSVAVVFVAAAVLTGALRQTDLKRHKDVITTIGSFTGINRHFYRFLTDTFQRERDSARAIGEIVGHSEETVLLTPYFGRFIAYEGELSGLPWPIASSLQERRERGMRIPPPDELFHSDYLLIRTHGQYVSYTPEYFIITAFEEFKSQEDLREFLEKGYPVAARSDDYLIYDLRAMGSNRDAGQSGDK